MGDLSHLAAVAAEYGAEFMPGEPLSKHTGFRTGGPCAAMIFPADEDALKGIVSYLREEGQDFFVLGLGSNVLASDSGYDGVVISTKKFAPAPVCSGNIITAPAGIKLTELCTFAAENGLGGMEFAFGIPGSLGGAVFMNAGAYTGEIKDIIRSVRALTPAGEIVTLSNEECGFSYRMSNFQKSGNIVLTAEIELAPRDRKDIEADMADFMNRRKTKQPLDYPSCGSTFKRPKGAAAAALIDGCGLRGFTVGGACVSEKHAGFVINKGGARTSDILAVAEHVQRTVKEETGYSLEFEIRFLGE